MRKLTILSLFFIILFSVIVIAEVPEGISVQGLIITPQGQILKEKTVDISFKILRVPASGPLESLHQEKQKLTTDKYGIINAILGLDKTNPFLNQFTKPPGYIIFEEPYVLQLDVTYNGKTFTLGPSPLNTAPYAITSKNLFGGEVVAVSESTVVGAAAVKGFGGSDAIGGIFFSKSSQLPALAAANVSGGKAVEFKNKSTTNPTLVVENDINNSGTAGKFIADSSSKYAVEGINNGGGTAISGDGKTSGIGVKGFSVAGTGIVGDGGTGVGGDFTTSSPNNPAIKATNNTGTAAELKNKSTTNPTLRVINENSEGTAVYVDEILQLKPLSDISIIKTSQGKDGQIVYVRGTSSNGLYIYSDENNKWNKIINIP